MDKNLTSIEISLLQSEAIEILKTIYDPELPVNIYDLGLIYDVNVNPKDGSIQVDMTLTSPACPVAETLPGEVENKLKSQLDHENVKVNLVWDPPFSVDRMPDHVKLELGIF